MKIIQAMKQIQDLQRKAEDLRGKVAIHCADLTHETPVYPDQRKQVAEWVQAHSDILKEILRLKVAIQRTSLETPVSIELGGRTVTKSIAEWVYRRRELAKEEGDMWSRLGDKNLKEGLLQGSTGQMTEVKIRRYFDPAERDRNLEMYRSEPMVIDGTLEVVNAVTDLIE
jgi:hypothetical protein